MRMVWGSQGPSKSCYKWKSINHSSNPTSIHMAFIFGKLHGYFVIIISHHMVGCCGLVASACVYVMALDALQHFS